MHRADFDRVLRKGVRRRGDHLAISLLRLDPDAATDAVAGCRLGLAVGRGAGHSPARARMRRLLRESFRALRSTWPPLELVVHAGRAAPGATLASIADELEQLVHAALRVRGKTPQPGPRVAKRTVVASASAGATEDRGPTA